MILRVYFDGDWKAAEFAAVFREIHELHEHVALRIRVFNLNSGALRDETTFRLSRRAAPLRVQRIKYGSPGFTDLVGMGALVREVRELIQFLIVHFREVADRKQDRELRQLQIAKAKLEILEAFQQIRAGEKPQESLGSLKLFSEVADFSDLPDFDAIAEAIFDGRVVHTEIVASEDQHE